MNEELKKRLIKFTNDVYFLQSEWTDLDWTTDHEMNTIPDGDLCEEFEQKLFDLRQEAQAIQELL